MRLVYCWLLAPIALVRLKSSQWTGRKTRNANLFDMFGNDPSTGRPAREVPPSPFWYRQTPEIRFRTCSAIRRCRTNGRKDVHFGCPRESLSQTFLRPIKPGSCRNRWPFHSEARTRKVFLPSPKRACDHVL